MPPPQADILPAPGRWIRVLSLKLFTMLGVLSLSLILSRSLSLSLSFPLVLCRSLFPVGKRYCSGQLVSRDPISHDDLLSGRAILGCGPRHKEMEAVAGEHTHITQ